MPHLMVWIEGGVASAFTLLFVLYAFLAFKPEHVEHHPTRVLIGAALQGFIIGVLFGFVILPLRFAFFVPDASLVPDAPPPLPKGLASLAVIPAFVLMLVIRRGLLARAPLVGRYLRAYRRAGLAHQIEGLRKTLARLENVDAARARKEALEDEKEGV